MQNNINDAILRLNDFFLLSNLKRHSFLLKKLAIDQNCSVLMVTHDPRILDVADRLINMEDGRLQPVVE